MTAWSCARTARCGTGATTASGTLGDGTTTDRTTPVTGHHHPGRRRSRPRSPAAGRRSPPETCAALRGEPAGGRLPQCRTATVEPSARPVRPSHRTRLRPHPRRPPKPRLAGVEARRSHLSACGNIVEDHVRTVGRVHPQRLPGAGVSTDPWCVQRYLEQDAFAGLRARLGGPDSRSGHQSRT
jgi:hypothetical protein